MEKVLVNITKGSPRVLKVSRLDTNSDVNYLVVFFDQKIKYLHKFVSVDVLKSREVTLVFSSNTEEKKKTYVKLPLDCRMFSKVVVSDSIAFITASDREIFNEIEVKEEKFITEGE